MLNYACISPERQKKITRLTEMIEKADSLKRELIQNKIDSVVTYQSAANSFMIRLKNNYRPRKVDMVFGRKIDEFKELQMLFLREAEENKRTLSGEYSFIMRSIEEVKTAMNFLKTDIEDGKGEKERYNEFIKNEQDKLNTIQEFLQHFIMRKKKYLPRFRSTLKELNDFMDKWEKDNKPKKN